MKFQCFIFFSITFQPFLSALKYSSEVTFFSSGGSVTYLLD